MDARLYLQQRYTDPELRKRSLFTYHRFFRQYSKHWDTTRATLLEVGGGPSIQIKIVAAPFVGSIVHGDIEENCNEEVRTWLGGSPEAFDWSPVVEFALTHCDGGESEVTSVAVKEREEEIRRKVSAVVHCDATKKGMLLDSSVVPNEGFDVIIACSALVYVAAHGTKDDFLQVFKNIYDLLKEGGYFCATICGRCTHYFVRDLYIPAFYITKEDVRSAVTGAGFHLEELECKQFAVVPGVSDVKEAYICVARK